MYCEILANIGLISPWQTRLELDYNRLVNGADIHVYFIYQSSYELGNVKWQSNEYGRIGTVQNVIAFTSIANLMNLQTLESKIKMMNVYYCVMY